jgi:hypothetical protein
MKNRKRGICTSGTVHHGGRRPPELPAGEWLSAEHYRMGRAIVGPDLSLPRQHDIFVIGDPASVRDAVAAKSLVSRRQSSNGLLCRQARRASPPSRPCETYCTKRRRSTLLAISQRPALDAGVVTTRAETYVIERFSRFGKAAKRWANDLPIVVTPSDA